MRSSISRLFNSTLVALSALGLAACGGGSSSVTVKLTDAPGDGVEKAVVTISKVYLQGGAEGEVVLMETPVTTDLLTLANDTVDLVKDAEVPHGTYKELRFVITGGYVQVKEEGVTRVYASSADYAGLPAGTTVDGDLSMPSLASSGLKVKFANDANVEVSSDEGQKVILVDFDVSQSFEKGNSNTKKWNMSPVIKGADLEFSGTVEATLALKAGVSLPVLAAGQVTLGGFSAVLVNAEGGQEPLAFTDANGDGTFEASFRYVLPGSYTVQLRAPVGISAVTTTPVVPAAVTVNGGAKSTVALTLDSVTVAAQ